MKLQYYRFNKNRQFGQRILAKQLSKQLQDNIIERKVYPEVLPRVEHYGTENGMFLCKILLITSK